MRKPQIQLSRLILILTISLTVCAPAKDVPPELLQVSKRTTVIEAFRPNPKFDRHDPSNIIRHEGLYWVFYTHNQGVQWGLERYTEQGSRGLRRFDCTMHAPGTHQQP